MGEVVANFFGLNQSKYQWVLDYKEQEERDKVQAEKEARQRRMLQLREELEKEQASALEREKIVDIEAPARE